MTATHEERLASELAARFRTIARTLDRLDRLEGERAFSGWFPALAENRTELTATIEALALQVLRTLSSPLRLTLLRHLHQHAQLSLRTLGQWAELERVPLYLELGELAQVGLVTLELETETVGITSLGRCLVDWMDDVLTRTTRQVSEWLELHTSPA